MQYFLLQKKFKNLFLIFCSFLFLAKQGCIVHKVYLTVLYVIMYECKQRVYVHVLIGNLHKIIIRILCNTFYYKENLKICF